MLKKIEAGTRTPSPPLQARFELLLGPPANDTAPKGLSSELHTIVLVDAGSGAVVDACIHDRRSVAASRDDGHDVQRVHSVDGLVVVMVRGPQLARTFSRLLMQRGVRRVVSHASIDGCDRAIAEALSFAESIDDGRFETPTVTALLGPELLASTQTSGPAEVRFANTGVVPRRPRQLIGRDELVDRVASKLTSRTDRFITLTGPGGVGKSSVALAALEAATKVLPMTLVSVDLSVAGDPDQAVDIVLAALAELDAQTDGPTWQDRLRQWTGVLFVIVVYLLG